MNSNFRIFLGTMAGLLVGIAGGYFLGQRMSWVQNTLESVPTVDKDSDEPDFDGTQRDMNKDGDSVCQQSQKKLDATLAELRKRVVGKDVESLRALKLLDDSQVAWQKSTEALMEMYWPQQDEYLSSYGSIFPRCFALMKASQIENRIGDLRQILDSEEGDVCAPPWSH